MRKRNVQAAAVMLLIGVLFVFHGVLSPKIINEEEIRSLYSCNRMTDDYLETDKYCTDPSSAPGATKATGNFYTYSGIILIVGTGLYFFLSNSKRKR